MHSMLAGSVGYVVGLGNDLKVSNTSGLEIQIDTGGAWLGSPGGWWYHNDAAIIKTHDAESAGQNRIDRIIIRPDRNTTAVKSEVVILKGTAAGSPVAPALSGSTILQSGTKYQITVVRDKSVRQLIYVNAVLDGNDTDKNNYTLSDLGSNGFGHLDFGNGRADGKVDLLRIWTVALTQDEIEVLENGGDCI